MDEIRTAKDGTSHFRVRKWFKEDAHFKKFGQELSRIVSGENTRETFIVQIPDLILWLWTDYELIAGGDLAYFFCDHPNDKDDEIFLLRDFEDYFDETVDYFKSEVGIPMWAELSIDNVDTSDALYDRKIEEYWGEGTFVDQERSSINLLYALENAHEGDLILNQKIDVYKAIIQDDSDWHWRQDIYYNWLEFSVNVDRVELEREQKLIGASYGTLSDEQRANLVLAAIDAMGIEELEENKVPQYLLSLLLNHPATSDESKAQIALIADDHIIKLKD